MRFQIGSIVEVFTKKKVDFGSWRCAEVMAYNRDGYTVRYLRDRGIPKEGVDKVKTEDVRPSAPSVNCCMTWSVGDVVEVLHGGYWKVSLIEGVLGEDCYQIHVVGSIDEFRAGKSSIRVRQEWKENKWMIMEKVSGDCEDLVSRMRRRIHMQQQHETQKQCDYKWQLVPSSSVISKLMKRSFRDSSTHSEDHSESARKRRAICKEVDRDVIINDSYSFVGKPCGGASRINHDGDKLLARATEPSDSVSNVSSVASCSIVDAISNWGLNDSCAGFSEDNNRLCSDAESSKTFEYVEGASTNQLKQDMLRHVSLSLYCHMLKDHVFSHFLVAFGKWASSVLASNK